MTVIKLVYTVYFGSSFVKLLYIYNTTSFRLYFNLNLNVPGFLFLHGVQLNIWTKQIIYVDVFQSDSSHPCNTEEYGQTGRAIPEGAGEGRWVACPVRSVPHKFAQGHRSPYVLEYSWIWIFYFSSLECSWINVSVLECSWRHNSFVTMQYTQVVNPGLHIVNPCIVFQGIGICTSSVFQPAMWRFYTSIQMSHPPPCHHHHVFALFSLICFSHVHNCKFYFPCLMFGSCICT